VLNTKSYGGVKNSPTLSSPRQWIGWQCWSKHSGRFASEEKHALTTKVFYLPTDEQDML